MSYKNDKTSDLIQSLILSVMRKEKIEDDWEDGTDFYPPRELEDTNEEIRALSEEIDHRIPNV